MMRRHALARALTAAVLAAGALVTTCSPGIALADNAISSTDPAQQAAVDRDKVLRIGKLDSRPEVRGAAWSALTSSRGAVALREFLETGLYEARDRAVENARRNSDYLRRINQNSIPGSAVSAGTNRVLRQGVTDNERAEYVQSGLERDQETDRANNNRYEEKLAQLTKADRDYVVDLALNDPGPQVRDAAKRALSSSDPREIGLFFKYFWASAAALDQESFRRFTADQDAIWHVRVRVLIEAAEAAEKAERESSGELARKARADAIGYWRAISGEADGATVNWEGERDRADGQARAWAEVAAHARGANTAQDWDSVARRGDASVEAWAEHARWAVGQADLWKTMAEQARASAEAAVERDRGDR